MDGSDWMDWIYPGGRSYRAPYGANKELSFRLEIAIHQLLEHNCWNGNVAGILLQ